MKFWTNRAKVPWYLCSIVGDIRGHRQEKWYTGWLRPIDRVHHYHWRWHVARHANGYVFRPIPYNLPNDCYRVRY